MKILFSPQVRDNEKVIYEFSEDVIKATHKGITDTFDFSGFGNGKLQLHDEETGEELIETELENPIINAERKDGVLHVELMNYIGFDATEEERFPEWIDHTEYEIPVFEEEEEIVEETAEEPVAEETVEKEEAVEEKGIEEEDSIIIEPSGEEGIEGWDDY